MAKIRGYLTRLAAAGALSMGLLAPAGITAQTDEAEQTAEDRGFVTRFIEDNLSAAGRTVTLTGFKGALASRATFDKLAIADADGEWLVIHNGAMQWSRSALLARRVDIAELSAERIELPRLPKGENAAESPEARDFSLPTLPVGIKVDDFTIEKLVLGESVLGQAAEFAASGAMVLSGGEGEARFAVTRQDGKKGIFNLNGGFSNSTRILKTDLMIDEADDGILVNLLGLHDRPSLKATIKGEGRLAEFSADLALQTDGQPRISGQIATQPEAAGDDQPAGTGFRVRLGGDVAALLPEDRREFFGNETQLLVQGRRGDDGAISVPVMLIDTDALNLSGSFKVNADGAPEAATLLLTLGAEAGVTELPISLPLGEVRSRLESGRLELLYDVQDGDGWSLKGHLDQLDRDRLTVNEVLLDGRGTVARSGNKLAGISGKVDFSGNGIETSEPALGDALGDTVSGSSDFNWQPEQALEFTTIRMDGSGYGLEGEVLLDGLSSGLAISGYVTARYDDISQLSALAGSPLAGAAETEVSGHYVALSKAFSVNADIAGRDLSMGNEQLDRILAGRSGISLTARRDVDGIELDHFSIDSNGLKGEAAGRLTRTSADIDAKISLASFGPDPQTGGNFEANAQITGPAGARKLVLEGLADDFITGQADIDGALRGETALSAIVEQLADGFTLKELHLGNEQLALDASGDLVPGRMDGEVAFKAPDLGRIGPGWGGNLDIAGSFKDVAEGLRFALSGSGENMAVGNPQISGLLRGTTRLDIRGLQDGGNISIDQAEIRNPQLGATASGVYGPDKTDLTVQADLPRLAVLGAGYQGSLSLAGKMTGGNDGIRHINLDGLAENLSLGQGIGASLAGQTKLGFVGRQDADGVILIETASLENPRLQGSASGKLGGGASDVAASLRADSIAFLGRGLRGAVNLTGNFSEAGGLQTMTVKGQAVNFGIGNPQADTLLTGTTRIDIDATRSANRLIIRKLDVGNGRVNLSASGDLEDTIRVNARLSDLGLLRGELSGAATAEGVLRRSGSQIGVDIRATGPGGTNARLQGSVAQNFRTMDLTATGTSEAAIANPFLRVRSIEGPVNFDIALRGAPALEAITGQIRIPNASLADPKLGFRLDNLGAVANFDRGRITVEAQGNVAAGGSISLGGAVTLSGQRPIDLTVDIRDVVFRDPNLYTTTSSGQVRVSGNLAEGPLISGTIRVSDTEIRIPSTGLGGAKDIPLIQHVNDTRPVRSTRAKAGLEPWLGPDSQAAGMSGPAATPAQVPARLDLLIEAPTHIFIRGRGVDAEMGGQLRLTGRANNVVPIGMFELIRGRVDLLGKRFDLTEGILEMQGSMVPVIRLVAQANQDGITTSVTIDGDARDPEITFSSNPEMPQEEVLSQLLFGRGLDTITPLQAAQLANAVAVLAGRGGAGIVGKLRESVGLDDLDLATDDEGNVTLRAGKYLSENVYTDVAVGADGTSRIELNLDITPELTARGSVTSEGNSSLGVFYERDF